MLILVSSSAHTIRRSICRLFYIKVLTNVKINIKIAEFYSLLQYRNGSPCFAKSQSFAPCSKYLWGLYGISMAPQHVLEFPLDQIRRWSVLFYSPVVRQNPWTARKLHRWKSLLKETDLKINQLSMNKSKNFVLGCGFAPKHALISSLAEDMCFSLLFWTVFGSVRLSSQGKVPPNHWIKT